MILIPVAGAPAWADIMTAFGTVGAVIAAVGIALWSNRHARKVREEEREREQLAEAYAVQVVLGERAAAERGEYDEPDDSVMRLAVIVVNRGSFTITGVEVVLSYDDQNWMPPVNFTRLSAFEDVEERLRAGWRPSPEGAMYGVLTPKDPGIRFETSDVRVEMLVNPYPLVRWTDRWGTRWEHRRGEVRQVRDGEEWTP